MSGLDYRRRQLAMWLEERRMDAALAVPAVLRTRIDAGAGGVAEGCLAPGEIYLLHPAVPGGSVRLWHMVILEPPRQGQVLVAPFSRYDTPALPGELRLGGDVAGLRVLALWNARAVSLDRFGGAWRLGELALEDYHAVLEVRRFLERGDPLSDAVEPRVGPPLWHPADPRHDYRDQEVAAMQEVAGSDLACLRLADVAEDAPGWEVRRVADAAARYGAAVDFAIGGSSLRLRLTLSGGHYAVDVVTEGGRHSRRFDGGFIAGVGGFRSLPIWGGMTVVPNHVADGGLGLHDGDGKRLRLQ